MGRMADAEKLSIPQLQMAIKNGTIPAYVGVPLLQDKVKQHQQAMAMQQAQQQQGQQSPIADQVMQEADQYRGIDELPTNLPTEEDERAVDDEYANGGIIAFAGNSGSLVPKTPQYSSEPKDDAESLTENNPIRNRLQRVIDQAAADAAARGQPISEYNFNESIDRALGEGIATPRPPIPSVSPRRISEAEAAQANMFTAEAASPGVAGLPAAQNVQIAPGQQGVGTAPAGGEKLTPRVGLENAPSTLKEAEAIAGKSPAAAKAVSEVDRYMAMLEKSGESVGREKKEALYMALISGGLAAAGGTSPNALANIAAGMVPAAQQYQKAISDIRKDDRARVEKLLAAGMGKEKLAMELRKLGIEDKKVDALVNYYNARAGAAGSGGDAAGDRQLRLLAFNSGKELTRVEADVARVRNSEEYREAARVLKMPFDPKSASPTIKAMRKNAEDTIGRIDTDLNRRLDDARDTVNFYRKEAGFESPTKTGGTGLPDGIPTGSRLAGKSGGKNVYEAPDGKRYIVD
jgi:hypothetical protein